MPRVGSPLVALMLVILLSGCGGYVSSSYEAVEEKNLPPTLAHWAMDKSPEAHMRAANVGEHTYLMLTYGPCPDSRCTLKVDGVRRSGPRLILDVTYRSVRSIAQQAAEPYARLILRVPAGQPAYEGFFLQVNGKLPDPPVPLMRENR